MKNPTTLMLLLIIAAFFISAGIISGQGSNCRVLKQEISGTYAGECRKGLAHGNGIASGTDRYEGQFNRGLPHGEGVYDYEGGMQYRGEWNRGLRQGKGEMIYHTASGDSVIAGYWRADRYIGDTDLPPYDVIRKDNLLSANLERIGDDNIIVIRYMMKGQINNKVRGLSVYYSSGTQFKTGTYEGLQDVRFPLDIKITYNTNNPLSRSSFDVVFECTINEQGKWEITLNN